METKVEIGHVDLNTIILLLVAMITSVNTYYARRVEINTNSMKDALVEKAGLLGEVKGRAEMKQEIKENRTEGESHA